MKLQKTILHTRIIFVAAVIGSSILTSSVHSQDIDSLTELVTEGSAEEAVEVAEETKTSEELVRKAWESSFKRDYSGLEAVVKECVDLFGGEASLQQLSLNDYPILGQENQYRELNDVGTCLFIDAEAAMNNGKTKVAIKKFTSLINTFGYAQAWDPSRGGFWKVAEKSQASIDILTGKAQEELDRQVKKVERTRPKLHTRGAAKIVNYTEFGNFLNVGTENYKFSIKDVKGLSKAVGEGIYPNTSAVYNNPRYKIVKQEGRLDGSHWDFVNTDDLEAAYFKWVSAPEPWGIRLFYLGMIFEKAKMYSEALKAYHALIVHFPKTVGYTYWQTPWYPGQAAIAKIRYILRVTPELNLIDKWMKIEVLNGYDNDAQNDTIITYPGKIVEKSFIDKLKDRFDWKEKFALKKIKKRVGEGAVRLVQYENDHWQLLVNNKPYVIKGITYAPTKVGQSPDKGTLANWMDEDTNENGLIDGPFEAWVDKNANNVQDDDEPTVGDFQLMKEMGANTLRIYHHPFKINKELLRKLFSDYGMRVILGDYLGKYAIGSGATWNEGTDYENEEHRKNMLESVKQMVLEHKDEPYVLMWMLGNENNYGVASNADKKPEAYYRFANEVGQWIKSVDPNHPVSLNNGDTLFLDIFAKHSSHIDIFTANVYRGDYGFGSFWEQVADAAGKPAFISEYGCPAYAPHLSLEEAEQAQALYHRGNWLDVENNLGGFKGGQGNALGAVAFEWLDEWWKNYEPYSHDRKSDAIGPFPGGYYFEEWFGLLGQGNGQKSPFLRQVRDSYLFYRSQWNKVL